jgi:hypothetical protein
MSISTMTTMAYRRRSDVATPGAAGAERASGGRTAAETATLAGESPATQSGVTSALATITGYIPTEILITYVAVAAALSTPGAVVTSSVGLWLNFVAFLVTTPVVVWLVYAGKVRTAGKPLPTAAGQWPRWEMVAATVGFVAWAFALPGTPFSTLAWYNPGVAGVAVLVAATALGLVTPLVGGTINVKTGTLPEPPAPAGPVTPPMSPVRSTDAGASAASTTVATSGIVGPAFLPSRHGLHFVNAWPHEALVFIDVPGLGKVALGDAANGLCGGMSLTAADLFEAQAAPPPDTSQPAQGSPRFNALIERQVASLDLGQTPLRLYELMNPLMPDRSRADAMVGDAWPKIRAELDAGHPSMIALVRTIDADPRALGHNHQVMAYGYEVAGDLMSLAIYDPNHPDDDTVRLSLSIADPTGAVPVTWSPGDAPVFCFIHVPYTPATPTAWT